LHPSHPGGQSVKWRIYGVGKWKNHPKGVLHCFFSTNMEWKGVLDNMDDLAKMIERDRETAHPATA